MENKLIEWTLDDEVIAELKRISIVEDPAIEQDFLLFNKKIQKFKTINNEERIITGPAMRANYKIERLDDEGNTYFGYFSEETVKKASQIFFKKNSNANDTNLNHELDIEGAYVFESWIVSDPELDKSKALGFSDINKGDWYVSMKIDNDDLWERYIKTGLLKGFSIEVKAIEKVIETESEELLGKIKQLFNSDIDDNSKYNKLIEYLK